MSQLILWSIAKMVVSTFDLLSILNIQSLKENLLFKGNPFLFI